MSGRRSRPIAILWIIIMWDSLSEKDYRGRTEKFAKEELKQRITECWEEISLAELRKSIVEKVTSGRLRRRRRTNRSSFRL
jgi:hypothetical protein